MPAAPPSFMMPAAQPSFMMPTTMDTPGARLPIGQPPMDTTPQFLVPTPSIAEGPASSMPFLGGFAAGLVSGA